MLTAGGFGFVLGNILLARLMLAEEYGALTLFFALTQVGLTVGPLGLEIVINRHQLDAAPPLLARALPSSLAAGVAMSLIGAVFYDLGFTLCVCLALAAAGASMTRIASAFLQSHERFGQSLLLLQLHNYVVVAGVPVLMVLGRADALPVGVLVASAYAATGAIGWIVGSRLPARGGSALPPGALSREGLATVGIGLAIQLLWQLERLVIPRALSVAALGSFAVIASVAASPFRMMQTGVGYTLLPGLRRAEDKAAMKRLIYREAKAVAAVAVAAIAALLFVTPFVMDRVLSGRYDFSFALLAAVIAAGLFKLWSGFTSATVQAVGSSRQLAMLNFASWGGVAVGVPAAVAGGAFGLSGVVWGAASGWLVPAAVGTVLSIRAIRRADPYLGAPSAVRASD